MNKCGHSVVKDGYGNCPDCKKEWAQDNPEKIKAAWKKHRKQNPEYNKEYKLRTRFGMSLDDFNNILSRQNYSCAICKSKTPKRKNSGWIVDHCHTTGKVRGILCHPCNVAIGFLEDSVEILDNAKEYLNAN